ncbi:MAG: PilZ domain-containing protein [Pseudomonadota bacterium]
MTDTTEKRSAPRHRVLKGGTISFGGAGLDCTVRNVSDTGAGLDLAEVEQIPPSFKLAIAADNFLRRCRMVWSKGRRIGVKFE